MQFVGRLLESVGLRLKSQQTKSKGVKSRIYSLDQDRWNDPDRLALLECLDRRWKAEEIEKEPIPDDGDDMAAIREKMRRLEEVNQSGITLQSNIPENLPVKNQGQKTPQTLAQYSVEAVPPDPFIYIYKPGSGGTTVEGLKSDTAVIPLSRMEALVALLSLPESLEEFEALVEGYSQEEVEEAIAMSDSIARRNLLRSWHEQLRLVKSA